MALLIMCSFIKVNSATIQKNNMQCVLFSFQFNFLQEVNNGDTTTTKYIG